MSNQPRPSLPVRTWRYFERHGLRRMWWRVREEFRSRSRPAGHREEAWLPSAGAIEVNPDQIYGNLDAPVDGSIEASGFMLVRGWACSVPGVTSIRVYVDGQHVTTPRYGQSRPDVADYLSRVPSAGASGFTGEVLIRDLNYGAHRLELVVEDDAGNRRILQSIVRRVPDETLYDAYFRKSLPDASEIADLERSVGPAATGPEIVIWVVARNGERLSATLSSIDSQAYPRWRSVIVVGEEARDIARHNIAQLANATRFTVAGPAAISDAAVVSGGYCLFLEAGETLTEQALYRFAARTMLDKPDLVYSDHDLVRADGWHVQPSLTPDWSPDYALAMDYVGGVYIMRDELRRPAAQAIEPESPAWRYDLLLRVTERPGARVDHLPQLLWSAPVEPADGATPAHEMVLANAQLAAATAALARRGAGAVAEATSESTARRVRWPIVGQPHVSIIVPTTGRLGFVEPLVESLTERTRYANYDLLFIDNSRGRHPEGIEYLRTRGCAILERDEDFNWAKLNNDGARATSGELLLFLNDDMEVTEPNWLDELVAQAQRPEVGAVGALLLYPDGRIQHAGVFIVGYGGGAVHMLQGMDPREPVYLDLHRVQREVSAVTGACMMVRREVFDEAGGFNELFEIAGNDIDLCLRLRRRGYRNIWTPYAQLVHHESASRLDTDIVGDETRIWQIWGDLMRAGDPYHSPHFAKDRVDFAIDARKLDLHIGAGSRPPQGINLIGYIRAEMGVGQAARGTAAALKAAEVPFTIVDYQYGNPSRMGDDTWARQVSPAPIYDVNVVCVNADLVPEAFSRLPADALRDRYTIGSWTWELPEFPDRWVEAFESVDEVWVPSTFVQQAVAAKSPVPVVRMPYAVQAPAGPFVGRSDLGIKDGRFLFLMMYDVYSVRQRKNPEGAIEAFSQAFAADDETAGLIIKVNNADDAERELLRATIGERSNITLMDRTLSRSDIDSLIANIDCFVSLHRSEGFGLAIAEAMALGKPVIATNWSGNVDFMDASNAACVRYEIVRLERDHGPYAVGQRWAEPDVAHAAWWMRELVRDEQQARAMGERARATIASGLSPLAVGTQIRNRLRYIGGTTGRRGVARAA